MALYMGFTGDMSPLYSELYHPLLITGDNFGSFSVDEKRNLQRWQGGRLETQWSNLVPWRIRGGWGR